jgi:hypothetical protein
LVNFALWKCFSTIIFNAKESNLKTFVEFRSTKFPSYEGEQEQTNPGIWGKRLAEYLALNLAKHGIITGEIILEDWGCYLPIQNKGIRLALCCGHQDRDDDQFIIFTDPRSPEIRKLFRKIDATPQFTPLINALEKILASDKDIKAVNWQEQS